MVKRIDMFECEICKRKYESENEATNCESQGYEGDFLLKIGDRLDYNVWSEVIDGKVENYYTEIELIDVHKSHDNSYYFKYIDDHFKDSDVIKVYGNSELLKIIQ